VPTSNLAVKIRREVVQTSLYLEQELNLGSQRSASLDLLSTTPFTHQLQRFSTCGPQVSAAFDHVDRDVLLSRLQSNFVSALVVSS